jgi:replicative DNA helicase
MGKSALALQLALNLANSGNPVVYFTLEMTNTELAKRATQSRDINREHRDNLIINQRANTPEKVAAFVKTARKAGKADAVFVDYLQLMSSGKKSESRVQEITAISRQLKRLAVNENVPVIALSQLNRQVENRENHRPRLSDLRDSGSIEQDADLVIMLSRQDYYRKNENPDTEQDGIAELIITKNRRGQTGIAQLIFLDEYVKFGDKTYI